MFRNGVPIQPNEEFHVFFDGETCRLTISEIFPEDSGLFKCFAKSDFGEAQTSCLVDVENKGIVGIINYQ